MVFDFKTYGCYPKEYNREVHGPYDPSRYYGKGELLPQIKNFWTRVLVFFWNSVTLKDPLSMGAWSEINFFTFIAADTPLAEVKLGELPAWLGRRSLNPRRWLQAADRAVWRYYDRWIFPKRIGAAAIYQVAFMLSASFYVINYHRIQHERHFKYH